MATVHFAANNSFSILNRYFADSLCNCHNKNNHNDRKNCKQDNAQHTYCASFQIVENDSHAIRQAGNDTSKDYQRYTIANTFCSDLFTNPHQENRSCCQSNCYHQDRPNTRIINSNTQAESHADCLNEAQYHCAVTSQFVNLFTTLFAFFVPTFQCWYNNLQKLQNNRSVDVWSNAHGKY
ncbi:hypothetical protein SDC9_172741 [bioreactor metagenome]|uniref:Uncharacterized protein n=1 Tax=bioreactor metagenome TaxID=1076179 RepID=A0A645GH74_9ZZZZ